MTFFSQNYRFLFEEYTAQNELLKSQIIGETTDTADKNTSGQFTIVKHIVFAMIWAFVAWHLLIVKEKNLPKYDIVVNFNQTKSKFDIPLPCNSNLFILL